MSISKIIFFVSVSLGVVSCVSVEKHIPIVKQSKNNNLPIVYPMLDREISKVKKTNELTEINEFLPQFPGQVIYMKDNIIKKDNQIYLPELLSVEPLASMSKGAILPLESIDFFNSLGNVVKKRHTDLLPLYSHLYKPFVSVTEASHKANRSETLIKNKKDTYRKKEKIIEVKSLETKKVKKQKSIVDVSPLPSETIFARLNDRINVTLEGDNWVYTGFENLNGRQNKKSVILETVKKEPGGRTAFVFKANKLGDFLLKFVNQNNITGNSTSKSIKLSVVTERNFRTQVSTSLAKQLKTPDALKATEKQNNGDINIADYLYFNGDYSSALKLYLKNYSPDDKHINDRLADIYFKESNYEVARKYWERNIEVETEKDSYFYTAVVGIMKVASMTNDKITVLKLMDLFFNVPNSSNIEDTEYQKDYIFVIKNMLNHKEYGMAKRFIDSFFKNFKNTSYIDEIYFYLGEIYENSTDYRNLKRALKYYKLVYQEYPYSRYYSAAKSKSEYLLKHFFYVR